MINRRLVIGLAIVGSIAGSAGIALAEQPGPDKNHNICVVYSPNQRYTNTTYYCVTLPDIPPAG
ncbi:MAG: hypothetical protein QOC82_1273 [Frankiaceae bacterium]|jgi:hypothetical protein|nr:hypothetical protein [Frankiaceae bacterium]MDQ1699126.1 hypothetical protein [Frankiaceae bacterium]